MNVELRSVSRRPPWPWWAVVLVLLWGALVATAVVLSTRGGQAMNLCPFKAVTGRPCPTCGGTRGVLAILRGEPLAGLLHNPLLFAVIILFLLDLLMRIVFGRVVRPRLSRGERIAAWIVVVAAVAANWVYVLVYVG